MQIPIAQPEPQAEQRRKTERGRQPIPPDEAVHQLRQVRESRPEKAVAVADATPPTSFSRRNQRVGR
ncbi:hypothetical protein GCM10009533_54690 [Saccharopolyspora spinosporotrichia]|uniref:Uncharacterized protein n=1 Tax=Saccharopolyspora erythraea TaxID=1836 RepID=A0ABN1DRV4_SACER